MKKMMSAVLAAALALGGMALAEEAEIEASGVISQAACSIQQADEGYTVYCYAQIFNNSDHVIALEDGMLEVISGEQLLADQQVERIWPSFINPGEHGYVYDVVRIIGEEGETVELPQVTGIDYRLEYMPVDVAYGNRKLSVTAAMTQMREDGPITVTCELVNDTDTDAEEPTVSYGLFTENGTLVYAGARTLEDIVLPAGQRIAVTFEIGDSFVQQWISYGAKPTQAQVSAVYRDNDD